ncbi:hypothetical protein B0H16DRAFT_1484478 [Mycena metata]|uniref:Uncharacterized protein n=1 Tax=Mycena metata TaxID=1033252 RepID=A0AAD7GJV6_9AGAR|nr:hypothetical protein B0H16DRAFT_1484478 [Mycena metata]
MPSSATHKIHICGFVDFVDFDDVMFDRLKTRFKRKKSAFESSSESEPETVPSRSPTAEQPPVTRPEHSDESRASTPVPIPNKGKQRAIDPAAEEQGPALPPRKKPVKKRARRSSSPESEDEPPNPVFKPLVQETHAVCDCFLSQIRFPPHGTQYDDLEPIPLPIAGRGPNIPNVYVCKEPHPCRPEARRKKGVDYVQIRDFNDVDTNATLLIQAFQASMSRRGKSNMHSITTAEGKHMDYEVDGGILILGVDDMLWSRNSSGDGNPEADVPMSFATHVEDWGVWRENYTDYNGKLYEKYTWLEHVTDLQNRLIGDSDLLGQTAPSQDKQAGGTAFERDARAKPLPKTTRAIPHTVSVEIPKGGLFAPVVSNTYDEHDDTEATRDRHDWAELCAEAAATGLAFAAPKNVADILREMADAVNAPPVGHASNPGFTNSQTNISHVERLSQRVFYVPDAVDHPNCRLVREDLVEASTSLGPFANTHLDEHDFRSGYSSLLSMSRLNPGTHPGIMVLMSLGVGRRLTFATVQYMAGVNVHAGTQPVFDDTGLTDAQVLEMNKGCVRILDIAYMSAAIMAAQGPMAFAALAPGKLLELPAEFRNPWQVLTATREFATTTTHLTWVADGMAVIKSHAAFAEFIGHASTQLLNGIFNQTPPKLNLRFDNPALLGSMWYDDENGDAHNLAEWRNGPGFGPGGKPWDPEPEDSKAETPAFGNQQRQATLQRIMDHDNKHKASVPVCVLVDKSTGSTGQNTMNNQSKIGAFAKAAAAHKNPMTNATATKDVAAADVVRATPSSRKSRRAAGGPGNVATLTSAQHLVSMPPRWAPPAPTPAKFYVHINLRPGHRAPAGAAAPGGYSSQRFRLWAHLVNRLGSGSRGVTSASAWSPAAVRWRHYYARWGRSLATSRCLKLLHSKQRPKTAQTQAKSLIGLFTLSHLEHLCDNADHEVRAALKANPGTDRGKIIAVINNTITEIASDPFSSTAAVLIYQGNKKLTGFTDNLAYSAILEAIHRQRTMIYAALGYRWLDEQATPFIQSLIEEMAHDYEAVELRTNWIPRLLVEVDKSLKSSTKVKIDGSKFVSGVSKTVIIRQQSLKEKQEDRPAALFKTMMRTIATILSFPVADKQRQVAYTFINHLCDTAGPEALLLERIYTAFSHPGRNLIGAQSERKLELKELKTWAHSLESHAIADPTSAEHQALQRLGVIYDKIRTHAKIPPMPTLPPRPVPQPDSMLRFLRLAIKLVDPSGGPPRLPEDSQYEPEERTILNWMLGDTDHRFPIRAHADSLRWVMKPEVGGSIFHPDCLQESPTAALFSAAQFRAFTYHSAPVQEKSKFESAQEFLDFVKGREKECIVDKPYGQPQPRTAGLKSNVQHNWDNANDSAYNSWLTGLDWKDAEKDADDILIPRHQQTYRSVLDIVGAAKTGKGDKKTPFVFCGKLAAHLLVADFVEAKVVLPPSPKEMGDVIFELRSGALHGMQALDYFHTIPVLKAKATEAFVVLYDHLDKALSNTEKKVLNWGPILLEHALCKYSRLIAIEEIRVIFPRTYYSDLNFNMRKSK